MIKNQTGQLISFLMLSATDGSGVNTGTTYVGLMKDGSAPVVATNSPFHKSNGSWTLSLTQAETNCDHLTAVMTISGAITAMVQVYTVDPATFKADVSSLATSTEISDIKGATWSASTDTLELIRDRVDLGVTLTAGIVSATDKLDSTLVWTGSGNVYKFTTDALSNGPTGGSAPSAVDIYSEFTTGTNADAFKSDVTALATTAQLNALNNITANDVYLEFVSGSNADAFKADVTALSTTAQLNALNNITANDVYLEFVSGSNADAFKANVTALATALELASVPKLNTAYTHTNQSGDTMTVTIS